MERKYVLIWGDSCSPSKLVRGFWILQGFIGIKLFESFLLRHFENDRVKVDFDFWFSLALALVMSMLGYRGATMKPQFSSDRVSKPTLEEEASIASWLTFNWLSQMFKTGYKRALELSDLTLLRQIDHAAVEYSLYIVKSFCIHFIFAIFDCCLVFCLIVLNSRCSPHFTNIGTNNLRQQR